VLLTGLVALLALPIGFAVAEMAQEQRPDEHGEWRHLDPDPSTDPVEMGNRLKAAPESGDTAALDQVTAEIREEILSRLGPRERAAAESAPPAPSVPEGTVAYIPSSVPSVLIDECAERVSAGKATALCELAVLHAEGRVRSGAFSAEEIAEILGRHVTEEER
jgi:hypothetical protein